MNAAVSYFTGLELLHLALYDMQVDEDYRATYNARERELRKKRPRAKNSERCAQWRDTHPEEYKAYQREYRKAHRERLNAQSREYRRRKKLLAMEGSE